MYQVWVGCIGCFVLMVIGHRGYPAKYPENTLLSFREAIRAGADGVELDVWLTRDGEVVVIHDPDTRRVAGVDLRVKDSTLEELRRLDLGMGQRIPLLSEVFDVVPPGKLVFVEIKDVEVAGKAYWVVVEKNRLEDTVFISFHPEALEKIRLLSSDARLGLNIGSLEMAQKAPVIHENLRLYTINPPIQGISLLGLERYRGYLGLIHRLGAKAFVWTVNRPEEVEGIIDLIDGVITNDPMLLKKYFESKK